MSLRLLVWEYLPSIFVGRRQALGKVFFIGNVQNSPVWTQTLEETSWSSWERSLSNRGWNSCAVVNWIKMFYTDWNRHYWIEHLILVTCITWISIYVPPWTWLLMEEVLLEKSFNSQFHVHQEYSEVESSDNRQVWEEKLLPTSLHHWKQIAHISAFGLHFVAALQCR